MSAAPVLAKAKNLFIEVTNGPLRGKTFNLAKPIVQIGRSSENDIALEGDTKVSRAHVQIQQTGGTIVIQNLSDKNTMMVNGQVVSFYPFNTAECFLRIGDSEFRIRIDGAAKGPQPQRPLYVPQPNANMPPPPSSQPQNPYQYSASAAAAAPEKQNKMLFYAIVGVVLVLGLWLMTGSNNKKKIEEELRKSDDVESDLSVSRDSVKKLEEDIAKSAKGSIQYETAQQHYIKGFRDFKQGQYGRAILSLQAALAFYPQHELARKYAVIAHRKLDEEVKYEMMNGQKYKGQGNFRMCVASYKKVQSMLLDNKDPSYQESAQYQRECELLQKDKY